MTKRRRLIRAGVPATAMGIRTSRVGREWHVVLLVRTSGGTFVLDNLKRDVIHER